MRVCGSVFLYRKASKIMVWYCYETKELDLKSNQNQTIILSFYQIVRKCENENTGRKFVQLITISGILRYFPTYRDFLSKQ